jgi:signal peptidase I
VVRAGAIALGVLVGIAFVAAVVAARAFPVKPYRVPSESMLPALEINDRILVERVTVRRSGPHRGDVVVLHPPAGADLNTCGTQHTVDQACPEPTSGESKTNFVKRVVGEPGDRLSVRGGRVYIDGRALDEPYARLDDSCPTCNLEREITIPPDHYFMMGDNRGESADSREWGPAPADSIVGIVVLRYWPPRRIGTL